MERDKQIKKLLKVQLKEEFQKEDEKTIKWRAKNYKEVGVILWDDENGDGQVVFLKELNGIEALDLYKDILVQLQSRYDEEGDNFFGKDFSK